MAKEKLKMVVLERASTVDLERAIIAAHVNPCVETIQAKHRALFEYEQQIRAEVEEDRRRTRNIRRPPVTS